MCNLHLRKFLNSCLPEMGRLCQGARGLCNCSVTQWLCRWWLWKMRYFTAETGPEPPRQLLGLNTYFHTSQGYYPLTSAPWFCTSNTKLLAVFTRYWILEQTVLCSKTGSTVTSTWILTGFKTFLQTIHNKVSTTSLGALFPSPNSLTAWNSLPNTDLTFTLPQMEKIKRCYQTFLVVWTSISVLFALRQY